MKKEITIDGVLYAPKSQLKNADDGQWVLIRAYASGVHFGQLQSKRDAPQGLEVTLANSRRIHYWVGAASLSQIAVDGIANAEESRVSVEITSITVSNVIEVIPITEAAFLNLSTQPVWKM